MFHPCIACPCALVCDPFPLPPSLLGCPFQTGPVRQDNNADYARGGPESCPQVTAAGRGMAKDGSTWRLLSGRKVELKTRNECSAAQSRTGPLWGVPRACAPGICCLHPSLTSPNCTTMIRPQDTLRFAGPRFSFTFVLPAQEQVWGGGRLSTTAK